ncbi:MAG TPA: DUF5655 domain-containing protein [Blastocatellia bacterium]|nr:DUF5655 domain-containing protein [Blastocatellia bacterium]
MGRSTTKRAAANPYSVHPGVAMVEKWVSELPAKTGRSLDEWTRLVKKSGPPTEQQRRDWLKSEHGLGTNAAWWIAERAGGKSGELDDAESYLKAAIGYVDEMYSGGKAGLRPVYDELLKVCLSIGKDAKACPCKTIVPFYRNHVFAQLKPTTRTRIDLGLALGNRKTPKRLIDTGGFAKKDRITHRIEITSLNDIDDEVKRWLKTAYDLDK